MPLDGTLLALSTARLCDSPYYRNEALSEHHRVQLLRVEPGPAHLLPPGELSGSHRAPCVCAPRYVRSPFSHCARVYVLGTHTRQLTHTAARSVSLISSAVRISAHTVSAEDRLGSAEGDRLRGGCGHSLSVLVVCSESVHAREEGALPIVRPRSALAIRGYHHTESMSHPSTPQMFLSLSTIAHLIVNPEVTTYFYALLISSDT
jgi:hypothetical protein